MSGSAKQVLVLAGGRGSRLRPYTTVVPKPLMPVGEQPVLEILLRQLRRAGVEEVIVAAGQCPDLSAISPIMKLRRQRQRPGSAVSGQQTAPGVSVRYQRPATARSADALSGARIHGHFGLFT